jgi:hypothetical protein
MRQTLPDEQSASDWQQPETVSWTQAFATHASVVHTRPSSQSLAVLQQPGTGVTTQPVVALHEWAVHTSPSVHCVVWPPRVHWPAAQCLGAVQEPSGLHAPVAQSWPSSGVVTHWLPTQALPVQALPSSHWSGVLQQVPALQQTPLSQWFEAHSLLPAHGPPFGRFVSQAPLLQNSPAWQAESAAQLVAQAVAEAQVKPPGHGDAGGGPPQVPAAQVGAAESTKPVHTGVPQGVPSPSSVTVQPVASSQPKSLHGSSPPQPCRVPGSQMAFAPQMPGDVHSGPSQEPPGHSTCGPQHRGSLPSLLQHAPPPQ